MTTALVLLIGLCIGVAIGHVLFEKSEDDALLRDADRAILKMREQRATKGNDDA